MPAATLRLGSSGPRRVLPSDLPLPYMSDTVRHLAAYVSPCHAAVPSVAAGLSKLLLYPVVSKLLLDRRMSCDGLSRPYHIIVRLVRLWYNYVTITGRS